MAELCSVCKKRIATVFITQMDSSGNSANKGLCLLCAKKMGLPQVSQFMDKMGISEDDLENLSNEMDSAAEAIQEMEDSSDDADKQHAGTNTPNFFKLFGNLSKGAGFGSMESPDTKFENSGKSTESGSEKKKDSKDKLKFLPMYGTDLTDKAAQGKIDNVIGRTREIERVIQIINRRTKNNPVLVGEAGVGKTAIAEGLALRISKGEVPQKLMEMKVYLLDLTAMVAGTQFRGQFEGRMKGLLDEVKKAGNIILVIDEIHNIMGAGEAEGSMNAANILKPALSRGEIQVIGATTLKEYRKYIEKDSALERRFQPVMVEEPSIADTIDILKGIKVHYEEYHKVHITDSLIEDTVKMAERYITDRFLPDKAIDVLDEAASRSNLGNTVLSALAEKEKALNAANEKLKEIEAKGEPESDEDKNQYYKSVAEAKLDVVCLEDQIKELKKNEYTNITFDDIAHVIENWTGIPVHTVSVDEAQRLLNLDSKLKEKVIGQDEAVSAVAKAIRRNRSGFRKKFKPASFIFVGPTGVGKTELVKQLAIELFGTEEALIRLDMSEYMEKHTVSKLIGSPPGYVGYDEAGQLTEQVRRRPYSVILMDEIEKAHADVFNMLLQILDDGRLTDSQGRTVHFENTVIIMTSNAGNSLKSKGIGFANDGDGAVSENANDALKEIFRPEFLNRVDEIITFKRLSKDSLVKIAQLMMKDTLTECSDKGIDVTVDQKVYSYLAENGMDEKYGARPIRRLIQKKIEDELSEMYLSGQVKTGSKVLINISNGDISIGNL